MMQLVQVVIGEKFDSGDPYVVEVYESRNRAEERFNELMHSGFDKVVRYPVTVNDAV